MSNDTSDEPESPGEAASKPHNRHTRADFERQVQATRAQFEATNERIEARTGRNLILAILIGLGLGLVTLFSLIFVKQIFMIIGTAAIAFAAFELTQAFRTAGRNVSRVPSIIAAVAIVPSTYFWHSAGQLIGLGAGVLFVWIWRLIQATRPADRVPWPRLASDLGAAALVQLYVTLLASFAVLLLSENNGQWWTLGFIIIVISVDTGAYASGLLFGKHPMAPTISPKKTWEGLAGAAVVSVVAGVLISLFMVHNTWWFGVIFGLVILFTATIGDLAESLIKRDLGIKDMSSWLPGHGGFLDRLDSILPSAVAAFALFRIFS